MGSLTLLLLVLATGCTERSETESRLETSEIVASIIPLYPDDWTRWSARISCETECQWKVEIEWVDEGPELGSGRITTEDYDRLWQAIERTLGDAPPGPVWRYRTEIFETGIASIRHLDIPVDNQEYRESGISVHSSVYLLITREAGREAGFVQDAIYERVDHRYAKAFDLVVETIGTSVSSDVAAKPK